MKYRDLSIQTQREAPNNARTQGFAFLVRSGYLTRQNALTPLGEYTLRHLNGLADTLGGSFFATLGLSTMESNTETFFPISSGPLDVLHCPSCKYTERLELAQFAKSAKHPDEPQLSLEKVLTPECHTIESLASFLGIPTEKTAKALMYTRASDGEFVFVIVRGDTQLSEAKLRRQVGEVRVASPDEIEKAGAAAGYASPIGLNNGLIIMDDLIPQSPNLVAGANQAGYHLRNTNHGRDYQADIVADLVQAKSGDVCARCGALLFIQSALLLATRSGDTTTPSYFFENILHALAEAYHDDRGLIFPTHIAPFDIYLLHIPGKDLDTRAKAEQLHTLLQNVGISILFDDRDDRAGIKFNDADLIGSPVRITVGERNLKDGMVELKERTASDSQLIRLDSLINLNDQDHFWDQVKLDQNN